MYKENICIGLKKARKNCKYSQAFVQQRTGISQSKISKIENGKLEPNINELGILIDFYEVTAQEILGTKKILEPKVTYSKLVSKNLTKIRIERKYTQEYVSKRTKIPRSTIANYETGRNEPNINILGTLAKFYNVSLDSLFGFK